MNITVFVVETVILLILFTAAVMSSSKNPLDTVYDLPQPIIDRCLALGLIDEKKKATSKETKLRKLAAAVFIAVLLSLILYFANGARTFADGFKISYIIWLIVDWYDCVVLDWCLVCNTKLFIIPGTEDLTDSYKDYKFHFIGSVKGMIIGLPVCAAVGGFTALAGALF